MPKQIIETFRVCLLLTYRLQFLSPSHADNKGAIRTQRVVDPSDNITSTARFSDHVGSSLDFDKINASKSPNRRFQTLTWTVSGDEIDNLSELKMKRWKWHFSMDRLPIPDNFRFLRVIRVSNIRFQFERYQECYLTHQSYRKLFIRITV